MITRKVVGHQKSRTKQRGQSMVEHIIIWPLLVMLVMGAIQLGLLYRAKATLNHAGFIAARTGALHHGQMGAMRRNLIEAMFPIEYHAVAGMEYAAVRKAWTGERCAVQTSEGGPLIEVLSPNESVFNQFALNQYQLEPCGLGESCPQGGGFRETPEPYFQIPNDNLAMRPTEVQTVTVSGQSSSMNIQDANLLKIRSHWCYGLEVPGINKIIFKTIESLDGDLSIHWEACLDKTKRHNDSGEWQKYFIPVSVDSVVRMQTPFRLEEEKGADVCNP